MLPRAVPARRRIGFGARDGDAAARFEEARQPLGGQRLVIDNECGAVSRGPRDREPQHDASRGKVK